MDYLSKLENQSIYILREAFNKFENLAMLWSIGKDSTVLLWLARKAFFGHVPFPLVHVDTTYKIPSMIEYRDRLVKDWKLQLIVGKNEEVLRSGVTYPSGKATRVECCGTLKKDALKQVLDQHHFTGVIVGVRRDEEPTRAKERYFSPRDKNMEWNVEDQPPELWDQFKTDFEKGTHIRIHPLLHWTELNVWEYIEREKHSGDPAVFCQRQGRALPEPRLRPVHVPDQVQRAHGAARLSRNCATRTPPSAPAAPRTKKVKMLLKNSDAMDTCEVAPANRVEAGTARAIAPAGTNDSSSAPAEQLKIVIVGHVDHGKSTFVGRLFHDTGSLPEGKLEQLQKVAERRGVPFEWANLMDALQSERDQNITIDTAQIWFQTTQAPVRHHRRARSQGIPQEHDHRRGQRGSGAAADRRA